MENIKLEKSILKELIFSKHGTYYNQEEKLAEIQKLIDELLKRINKK